MTSIGSSPHWNLKMTYLRLKDVPPPAPNELVARQSRIMRTITFVITLALFIGVLLIPAPSPARYVLWFIAAFLFLIVWLSGRMLQRSFGSQNWLIRATPARVLIKFRSFANAHFDETDEVVVELRGAEIESIGVLKENWLRPRGEYRAPTQDRSTSLEFRLKGLDLDELSQRLAAERSNMGPGARSKTRYGDAPVRVVDGILRVQVRGSTTYITPSPRRLAEGLSKLMKIELRDLRKQKLDLANPSDDQTELENQILELAERGDRIAAMTLVRERYGCSLAEAKKMVEELCQPAPAA
jgi:hypothetical protein